LGPEYPDTLTARAQFAHWTGEAGDPAAARDLYAALLPVRERVSGPEDPARTPDRPAATSPPGPGARGDGATGRDLYAALLPLQERICGPEHPGTLAAANLAHSTEQTGDPASACDLYAALLPVRERVSGPEHPDTLTVRSNLAFCTGRAGDGSA